MSRANLGRLALLGMIWGSSFLLIKLALEGLSPIQIVLARLLGASVVLLGVVAVAGLRLPRDPRLWRHLVTMGVVANIVPFWLFGFAEQRISSGLAGVLNGTTPLFTLLVLVGAGRLGTSPERLTRTRVAGLLLGFLGTLIVVAPWRAGVLGGTVAGQLACLGAAACYGLAFVYTRRYLSPSGHSPLVLSAGQLGSATVVLGVVSPLVARTPVDLDLSVTLSVVVLGVLMTGLAYLLYYRLVSEAGAASASMVTYLIPVVAVALGVGVLNEPLTWNLFAGAAVVIAGVALAEGRLTPSPAERAPQDPPLADHAAPRRR